MERSEGDDSESSTSQQNTIWKQFQAKAKPLLSPKLGSRDSEDKKERGGWMFKKMRRKENVALDRVISSSQPDLLYSPVDSETKKAQLCDKAAESCSGLGREKLSTSTQQSYSSNKPTVAQLVQSHHKSSSLGSACLDRLVEPPGGSSDGTAAATAVAAEAQLENGDEQLVSPLPYISNMIFVFFGITRGWKVNGCEGTLLFRVRVPVAKTQTQYPNKQ